MSADKRKQILLGFGALAVVLVAVIALVSPKFKSEDAMGAIGAVQKHRAPQIAQKDVILGDEHLKQLQQVSYSDFLADAAALQNMSASMSTGARAESVSRLSAQSHDVQSRYLAAAKSQVAEMRALMSANSLDMKALESLDADINAAQSRALQSEDLFALNARLDSEVAALEARIQSRSLQAIEADVASLGARIENTKNLDEARSSLAAAARSLDARANSAAMIRARADYLGAMAKEARSLQSAEQALSAGSRADSVLGDEAAALSQRAVLNMKTNLSSATADVDAFAQMRASLDAMAKAVDSRSNTYNAASLASFRQDSGSFARAVEARSAEAASRANAEMRGQLSSITNYLGSVRNLDSRVASRANIAECTAQLSSINQAARSNALYASVLADSDRLSAFSTIKSRTQ